MKHDNGCVRRRAAFVPALMALATGAAFAHSKQEVTFPEDGAVLRAPPLLEIVLELLLVHLAASRAQLKRHLMDHPSPLPAQPYAMAGGSVIQESGEWSYCGFLDFWHHNLQILKCFMFASLQFCNNYFLGI